MIETHSQIALTLVPKLLTFFVVAAATSTVICVVTSTWSIPCIWYTVTLQATCIYSSIYLLLFLQTQVRGHGGNSLRRYSKTSLALVTYSSSSSGTPKHFRASGDTLSLQCVPGLPQGLLPEHLSCEASGRHLKECAQLPSYLCWLLLMGRSSGYKPS